MYDRGRIDRRTNPLRRLEAHLTGGLNCCFVQTVTQAAHYAIHMHLPVRTKKHLQQNFSFELELPGFLCVNRVRLGNNFYLRSGRTAVRLSDFRSVVSNFLGSETGRLHGGGVISIVPLSDSVSETRARDRTFDPFRSPRTIAGALPFR